MLINELYAPKVRPVKVLQFGEGNFLRCFVDWIIQNMNEANDIDFSANVCVVQPLANGMIDGLKKQNGLYTVLLEGLMNQKIVEEHIIKGRKEVSKHLSFQ